MINFVRKFWNRGDRVKADDINRWEVGIADAHEGLDSLASDVDAVDKQLLGLLPLTEDTGWIEIGCVSGITGLILARRSGNVVSVQIGFGVTDANLFGNFANVAISTTPIPPRLRPRLSVHSVVLDPDGTSFGVARIGTDGLLEIGTLRTGTGQPTNHNGRLLRTLITYMAN